MSDQPAADVTSYDSNVFINCPFDPAYQPVLDAIVFTVILCGHVARSALEIDDSGRTRFGKIVDLIGQCRLGIHDLSRTDQSSPGALPRFNMPLELGLFLGATEYGGDQQRRKRSLVLDIDRTRYRDFISDLAGHDIKAYDNLPAQVIAPVRDFLRNASGRRMAGGASVAAEFAAFSTALPGMLERARIQRQEATFADMTALILEWLGERNKVAQ